MALPIVLQFFSLISEALGGVCSVNLDTVIKNQKLFDKPFFKIAKIIGDTAEGLFKLSQKNRAKGQKISKANYHVLTSSKKRTKYLPNIALATRAEDFRSFFGRIDKEEI